MNGRTTLRQFFICGALPVLAATLVLAGCGSGGGSSSSSTGAASTASATSTASAKLSAFETCLKQHGVKINPGEFRARPRASFTPTAFPTGSPFPRPSGIGSFLSGRNSAAFRACAKYAPSGFGSGFGRAISSSALAAFKTCLGANGVKVTGKTAAAVLAELRTATGKKAAAVRTCRVLLQPTAPTPSPTD
jgi:hypothetical protein